MVHPVGLTVAALLVPLLLLLHLAKYLLSPFYRLLFAPRVQTVVRTPEERFLGLDKLGYPFSPNYLSIDVRHPWNTLFESNVLVQAGCGVSLPRVHYLDEGPRDGPLVLCLHGEPAWSFLYRCDTLKATPTLHGL